MESTFASLLDEALEAWQGVRQDLIEEVKGIPAEQFDFRPAAGMRSAGEVVRHVLEVAAMMAGELPRPDTDFHRAPWPELLAQHAGHLRGARTKGDLLRLLRTEHAAAHKKFRAFGEIAMLQLIARFDGRQGTRLAWLHHGIGHEMYHTGQLTAYARALGLVPALTRRIEG